MMENRVLFFFSYFFKFGKDIGRVSRKGIGYIYVRFLFIRLIVKKGFRI